MSILVRTYQTFRPENWDEALELAKRGIAVGKRLGLPPLTFYRCLSPSHSVTTLISDREWPSLAAMEADYDEAAGAPVDRAIWQELTPIIESTHIELFLKMDLEE